MHYPKIHQGISCIRLEYIMLMTILIEGIIEKHNIIVKIFNFTDERNFPDNVTASYIELPTLYTLRKKNICFYWIINFFSYSLHKHATLILSREKKTQFDTPREIVSRLVAIVVRTTLAFNK